MNSIASSEQEHSTGDERDDLPQHNQQALVEREQRPDLWVGLDRLADGPPAPATWAFSGLSGQLISW